MSMKCIPLIPHFYTAKLGYAWVYLFLLGEGDLMCILNLRFKQKEEKTMKNFLLNILDFYNLKTLCIT